VFCSSTSAVRSDSPCPGFTWKNKLNSLVEPTLKPGRDELVADADIGASR
jgi:hypothetical protein